MSNDSSAKYYQNNNERYQSLSKEQKEKIQRMVMNDIKIYQKMKNKSFLSKKNI